MSEMGELWKAYREAKREEKLVRKELAPKYLARENVRFTSHNFGVQLNLTYGTWRVIYWPGTNRWKITQPILSKGGYKGSGLKPLVQILKTVNPQSEPSSVRTACRQIQDSWYSSQRKDCAGQTLESASD